VKHTDGTLYKKESTPRDPDRKMFSLGVSALLCRGDGRKFE